MKQTIRIGTRDSVLALWQAHKVQSLLEANNCNTEVLPVKSTGDLQLDVPLYEMGITGIFTKTLDVAMIKGEIDIAVHSMKDVPTAMPKGMIEGAVLKRAAVDDLLVYKPHFNPDEPQCIATGSLRRKAEWLHQHPHHKVIDLRGNVQTRIKRLLENEDCHGAIFAKAGLQRADILKELADKNLQYIALDSMIPAPAQGAILVACRGDNPEVMEALKPLHDTQTAQEVLVERHFLRELEGGCTAPIGALARVKNNELSFTGTLMSLDGKQRLVAKAVLTNLSALGREDLIAFAKTQAQSILDQNGHQLMAALREHLGNKS